MVQGYFRSDLNPVFTKNIHFPANSVFVSLAVSAMASSKPKMSPQEISELVQNLHAMGQLENVMREARLGFPMVTGESMNDSSKRCLFADDEEDAEFPGDYEGPVRRKRQQPIMPKPSGGSSSAEAPKGSLVLEMGLSIADWGQDHLWFAHGGLSPFDLQGQVCDSDDLSWHHHGASYEMNNSRLFLVTFGFFRSVKSLSGPMGHPVT